MLALKSMLDPNYALEPEISAVKPKNEAAASVTVSRLTYSPLA